MENSRGEVVVVIGQKNPSYGWFLDAARENVTKFYHAGRNHYNATGFSPIELSAWTDKKYHTKGEFEMDWSTIADYFTIAFLLWYGLKGFVTTLRSDMSMKLGAALALITAVTTYLSL